MTLDPEMQTWMTRPRTAIALLAMLGLVACGRGSPVQSVTSSDESALGQAATTDPTDVAAPDVFHVTEPGLWDGRPSLGGTWVAYPDVTDPERVRIVNQANGQSVIGALFRRERDLPGPALQVSSDAAEALGMLPGAPATLDVVALRRTEAPAPAAASPDAEATGETVEPAAFEEIPANTLSGASASSRLEGPFVPLGSFGTEAHARNTAEKLAAKALPVRLVQRPGQEAWRPHLGPAATAAEQSDLLGRAVAEGSPDAYLVRR